MFIKYKKKQENILIKTLAGSSFVTEEMLFNIKNYYNENVPYHNFLHVLQVSNELLKLNIKYFNILEIKSLLFASLFHDAGHTGQVTLLDEFNSLDIALTSLDEFEKKYNIGLLDKSLVRKAIVGTVFTKRGGLENRFSKIMGDLDIGVIGGDFLEFCYYGFPFGYELNQIEEEYIKKTEINYFKFLMNINKKIFLTKEVEEILPNALKNIKFFLKVPNELLIDMMKVIKNKDITYNEFCKLYEKKINNIS